MDNSVEALNVFISNNYEQLGIIARRFINEPEENMDLIHDVYLKLNAHFNEKDMTEIQLDEQRLWRLFYVAMKHKAFDHHRKKKRSQDHKLFLSQKEGWFSPTYNDLTLQEVEEVSSLDQNQKLLFRRLLCGFTHKEIAQEFGATPLRIKRMVFSMKRRIRNKLSKEFLSAQSYTQNHDT